MVIMNSYQDLYEFIIYMTLYHLLKLVGKAVEIIGNFSLQFESNTVYKTYN